MRGICGSRCPFLGILGSFSTPHDTDGNDGNDGSDSSDGNHDHDYDHDYEGGEDAYRPRQSKVVTDGSGGDA